MTQCSDCRTERDISTEGRLARVEAKLESIDEKLDDAIIGQLKDHGRRIHNLEKRNLWQAGWLAGAMAAGAIIIKLWERI